MEVANNLPRPIARAQEPLDVALKVFVQCSPVFMGACVANAVFDIKAGLSGFHPHLTFFNGFSSILGALALPFFVARANNMLYERGFAENRIGLAEIKEALPRNLCLVALWTAMVIAWQ